MVFKVHLGGVETVFNTSQESVAFKSSDVDRHGRIFIIIGFLVISIDLQYGPIVVSG